MAITWADNFQNYGTGAEGVARLSNGPYAEIRTNARMVVDPDPNEATNVFRQSAQISNDSNTLDGIRKVYPLEGTTRGGAMRVWFSDFWGTTRAGPGFVFRRNDGTILVTVMVMPTGQLRAYRGSSNTVDETRVLATTVGPVLVTNAWQHIEFKLVSDAVSGELEVRIEGVSVISLTGINTTGGAIASFGCGNYVGPEGTPVSIAQGWYVKDLVMWDTSGTENVDFVGSVGVFTLWPASDVALNWTPSVGTEGWSILDNNPAVDTQYIAADDTPPAAYVATMTNLPEDVTSVKALMTVVRARKTDGGDGNLQVSLISNGDEDAGADRPLTTAFTYWFDVSETDPDTGVAWSPASVDNVELKIDRTL